MLKVIGKRLVQFHSEHVTCGGRAKHGSVACGKELQVDPRPAACRAMVGHKDRWRIKVGGAGDYRVIYEVHHDKLLILAVAVARRREVCRRTDRLADHLVEHPWQRRVLRPRMRVAAGKSKDCSGVTAAVRIAFSRSTSTQYSAPPPPRCGKQRRTVGSEALDERRLRRTTVASRSLEGRGDVVTGTRFGTADVRVSSRYPRTATWARTST